MTSELILPPLLNAIKTSDPTNTAISQVVAEKSGAGDLYWWQSSDKVHLAIVLEPEIDQNLVAEMLPLVLVALSDCLAVLLPPQVSVQFRDEQFITVNGGVAGRVYATMAEPHDPAHPPSWLVVSVEISTRHNLDNGDPGLQPDITSLSEEGWQEPDNRKLIETFARHFLSWMVAWQDDGFASVKRAWKFKAENELDPDMAMITKSITVFEGEKPYE